MSGDPFRIEGPALISFSGGRTSAYMLWRIWCAWAGILPPDVKVTFANTGKEMPATLDFVRDCGERWAIAIVWLERPPGGGFRIVDHATAARRGEPFQALIDERGYLPNPVARICTQELKVRAMRDYARSLGWAAWTNIIGLRADEPHRVARMRENRAAWDNAMPLAAAGVTKRDVAEFWARQNWGLALPSVNGVTPAGNCDLCFLKSADTIRSLMREQPALADWWIAREAESRASKPTGARFRIDRPSYADLLAAAKAQHVLPFGDDAIMDCFCGEPA